MLRLKPRQSVDCWSERPGLLLPQPQRAGDAPPGTDEDDEREQPHSQTPGKACLRLDNVGGSRWIPGGRSAGLGWAGGCRRSRCEAAISVSVDLASACFDPPQMHLHHITGGYR